MLATFILSWTLWFLLPPFKSVAHLRVQPAALHPCTRVLGLLSLFSRTSLDSDESITFGGKQIVLGIHKIFLPVEVNLELWKGFSGDSIRAAPT